MKIKHILIALALLFSAQLSAQQDSLHPNDELQETLFDILENQTENLDVEEIADYGDELEELWQTDQININDLSPEVAFNILHLTDYQYYQLLSYIELYGELVSEYELAAIAGFDQNLAERLSKIVNIEPKKRGRNRAATFFRQSEHTLLLRYRQVPEHQSGYHREDGSGYLGNPMRFSWKYTMTSGDHFAMALAGEKDAGEQWFRGTQKQGFDHYAWYINVKNIGVLKNLVIGNYTLSFGQGMIMGGRSMGVKGGGAGQIRRFPGLVRATAPMNESSCMHGVAATIGNSQYTGTLFYSHNFLDGKIGSDSLGAVVFEGSLTSTGYHRTEKEVAQRNTNRNRCFGGHLQIKRRIFEVGVTGCHTQFVIPVARGAELYQKYRFCGKGVSNAEANYKIILHKTILFGEAAVSIHQRRTGVGVLQGGVFDLDPRSKLAVLLRYYSRDFTSLYGSSFRTNSSCNSEVGAYVAADFVLGRKTELSLNADIYHFLWLKYQVAQPTVGYDCSARITVNLTRALTLNFRYHYAKKEQNLSPNEHHPFADGNDMHKFRLSLKATPSGLLTLQTEVDYLLSSSVQNSLSQGFLLFQDLGLKIERCNLSLNGRIALFATDSYAERLYAYEHDLYQTFTINSYYGKGVRYYLMVGYQYSFIKIQARFSQTLFDDRHTISSGLVEIKGNTKSEIALQMIFHIR